MKGVYASIKNVETEGSELRRENANVQKCLKVYLVFTTLKLSDFLIKFSDYSFADSEKHSTTMLMLVGILGIFVGAIMNMMYTKIIGNFI
jgi:hypothetical protein